ncbi:SMI1/KNR4 family protein [Actinospica robiniae]|uniref:SMI1/KNR4 family protein n=1 Tax=Actinospica robiniae TaxID=304901 RepID=UPI000412A7E7|nr:SMI1/KNR4 family protein [Actinospica robiniae]
MAQRIFAEEQYSMYDSPPLDQELIRRAEKALEVRLPRAYLNALGERNGGILARQNYRAAVAVDGRGLPAEDQSGRLIAILALLGIGGRWGVDVMSRFLVEEWEYPPGIVICMLPSGGRDTVMLDYAECGPQGEPSVVYIGDDRIPRRIAPDFQGFLDGLV